MTDSPNIVEKVFGADRGPDKVSPLFTHFKQAPKDALPAKGRKPSGKRYPAAVDFGASSVKLVQLAQSQKDGSLELAAADEEIYEASPQRDLPSRQVEALRRLLRRNPDLGVTADACLSSRELQAFNFTFPQMPHSELESAAEWKVRQLKPFNLEPEKVQSRLVQWDSSTRAAGPQRVTVVCASSEAASRRVFWLSQAGFKASMVEPAPASLVTLRKFQAIPAAAPGEVVVWLDLGSDESSLVVEKNGVPYFLRSLSITSAQFTRQLAQSMGISEDQAESMKRSYGIGSWKGEAKSDSPSAKNYQALASLLENLVIDIEHSFKYFSYQASQSQITGYARLALTGGGAAMKNLDVFLAEKLGVPVEVVKPLSAIKISESFSGQKSLVAERSFSLCTAAGLAFGGLLPKGQRMNLLPRKAPKTVDYYVKLARQRPRAAAAVAAGVAFLLLAPQLARLSFAATDAARYEKELKAAKAEVGGLQAKETALVEALNSATERKRHFEAQLKLLKESGGDRTRLTEVLNTLATLLPEDIWVTKLNYAKQKMTMVGLTLDNGLIVTFIDSLKQSNYFKDVTFTYSLKEPKSSIYRFEVTMMAG